MKTLELSNFETIKFHLSDVEGCRHYLNDHKGVIVSPLWPKYYPSKSNCEWRITTAPGHRIKLTFDEFSIEPHDQCVYDYIELFSAPSKLLGKYCGGISDVPSDIISDEEELIVKFKSDDSVQRHGFQAAYSSGKKFAIIVYVEFTNSKEIIDRQFHKELR